PIRTTPARGSAASFPGFSTSFHRHGPTETNISAPRGPAFPATAITRTVRATSLTWLTTRGSRNTSSRTTGRTARGLGGAASPACGGWGGRYVLYQPLSETRPIWTNNQASRDTVTADNG